MNARQRRVRLRAAWRWMDLSDIAIRFQITRGRKWYTGCITGVAQNGQVKVAWHGASNGVTRWWPWYVWPHQIQIAKKTETPE